MDHRAAELREDEKIKIGGKVEVRILTLPEALESR